MARKTNYAFEKNRRAREKAAKREAKAEARREAKLKKKLEEDGIVDPSIGETESGQDDPAAESAGG